MNELILAAAVFAFGYLLNILYITVLYHRGLAHGSVKLSPLTRAWAVRTGSWVTGIDPKAWACMHRMHHQYSDTPLDPHSPKHLGIFGVMLGQLRSYERALVGLARGSAEYAETVRDLDFPVHWLNRKRAWYIPYLVHAAVAVALAFALQSWLVGTAYWLGIMSHPIQGWMVNSFAHRYGYENHSNGDQSRNNTLVAWLVFGEGYQNNHHARPSSPKFSERWFEVDAGYALCRIAEKFGLLTLSPVPSAAASFDTRDAATHSSRTKAESKTLQSSKPRVPAEALRPQAPTS